MNTNVKLLSDVINESKLNFRETESGIDSFKRCPDKTWFKNYSYEIIYNYNSRGFRDNEWPNDLKNVVWCIGDSFTTGIGVPYEHTWTYLLAKEIPQKVINVSMDGASNDYIARMSCAINKEINPFAIIHHWSYTHRREKKNKYATWFTKSTEEEDIENFITNIKQTSADNTIHSFIPLFEPPGEHTKNKLKQENIPNVIYNNEQLDYGRDRHHYDIITATKYVQYYKEMLNGIK
jgi:hypothetical protein